MDHNPNQNTGFRPDNERDWMVNYAMNLRDIEDLAKKHGVKVAPYSRTASNGSTFAARLAQLEAKIAESGRAEGRKEAEAEIAELKGRLAESNRFRDAAIVKNVVVNGWFRALGAPIVYASAGEDAIKSSLAAIEAKLIEKGRVEGREEMKANLAQEKADQFKRMAEGGMVEAPSPTMGTASLWLTNAQWGKTAAMSQQEVSHRINVLESDTSDLKARVDDLKAKLSEPVKVTVTVDVDGEA